MMTIEQVADRVTKQIANKYQYFSTGAKDDIRAMIVREFSPIVVQQQNLTWDEITKDTERNGQQAEMILQLLKHRRSEGATNWELANMALKWAILVFVVALVVLVSIWWAQ
jgi:hypothetical protein